MLQRRAGIAAFIVWTTFAIVRPAGADVIADWNICAQPIIATGRATIMFGAGPGTQLDLATVHLAMHDAIQAYDRRFEPYAGVITAGKGSAVGAASRAAHTLLLTTFPAQENALDACYDTSMTGVDLTPAELADSDAVGNAATANVLAFRHGSGAFPTGPIALHGRHGSR